MLGPADYCREDWECLICGAPKEELYRSSSMNPNSLRCRTCAFAYSLTLPPTVSKKRYVPRPSHNKRWREVWERAWWHFKDPEETRRFMGRFILASDANNAMNRLDGGGMIARERAARERKATDYAEIAAARRKQHEENRQVADAHEMEDKRWGR